MDRLARTITSTGNTYLAEPAQYAFPGRSYSLQVVDGFVTTPSYSLDAI